MGETPRPVSDQWGNDRGTPIDRYYIAAFLADNRADIRGRCLEVRDSSYTDRFGSDVVQREVLDIDAANRRATIVADLASLDAVAVGTIDCFICTQTLQFVTDLDAAVRNVYELLAPGGRLLMTVPSISKVGRGERSHDRWRFTELGCETLLMGTFGRDAVSTRSYGNVVAAMAFLDGIAAEELSPATRDYVDEAFPIVIAARAVKGDGGRAH